MRPWIAALAVLFWPSRFVRDAQRHAIEYERESNEHFRAQYDSGTVTEERLTRFADTASAQVAVMRSAFGYAFVLTIAAMAVGWATGTAAGAVLGPPSKVLLGLIQAFGAAVILAATLAEVGKNIATYDGASLPEKVNQWVFRTLYVIGTFLFVFSPRVG
jgi:hypothetical protein